MTTEASPPIELIVGPYRSGKSARLLDEIVGFLEGSPLEPVLLVVPSARYRLAVESALEERLSVRGLAPGAKATGIIGLEIAPFYEVCQTIIKSAGRPARVLPEAVRPCLVGQAMRKLAAEGGIGSLAGIAGFAGCHSAVLGLIDEFQRAGLSPDDVLARLAERAHASSRYVELARVYAAYWQELDSVCYLDRRRLAFSAREILFSGRAVPLSYRWIAADGFDRLSRLQSQVFLGMSGLSSRFTLLFDYDCAGMDGLERSALEEYGWKESGYQEMVRALRCRPQCQEAPLPAPSPEIALFSALDRYLEMEEIARRCKERIVRDGVAPDRILVVARDLDAYAAAADCAFKDAGVPASIDAKVELAELPLTRFVLGLLRLAHEDFPRGQTLQCLRSAYMRGAGLSQAEIDTIDRLSLAAKLVSGRKRWDSLAASALGAVTARRLLALFHSLEPPADHAAAPEYCRWVEDLIDALVLLPEGAGGDGWNLSEDENAALSGMRQSLAVLIRESVLLEEGPLAYGEFLGRLERVVEKANFRRAAALAGTVTICGADVAPNRRFACIFVAGMIEGEFPRRTAQEGFVSADETARWAALGVNIDNPRHHPGFELALFLALMARAGRSITFSYPRYEFDGAESIPSFFLSRLATACDFVEPHGAGVLPPASLRQAALSALWSGFPGALEQLGLPPGWAGMDSKLSMVRGRQAGGAVFNGNLRDFVETGALSVPEFQSWSATRLNRYGQCPFQFWLSDVLRLRPRLECEAGLPDDRLGEFYHRVLETFYRSLKEDGMSVRLSPQEDLVDRLDDSFALCLAQLESAGDFTAGEFWEYEKIELRFRLHNFLLSEIERAASSPLPFEPAYFEARFGRDEPGSFPPLTLTHDGSTVNVSGAIDRIDVASSGGERLAVRIVDYKKGGRRITLQQAFDGCNVQMPLYALAVERAILLGSRVVEGLYLSVNAASSVGRIDFSNPQEAAVLAAVERQVHAVSDAVRTGDFSVAPRDRDYCTRCDHRSVCRIAEIALGEEIDEPAY